MGRRLLIAIAFSFGSLLGELASGPGHGRPDGKVQATDAAAERAAAPPRAPGALSEREGRSRRRDTSTALR